MLAAITALLLLVGTGITIFLGARQGRREKAELEREERHKEVQRNISRLERELEVGKWDPARLALELDGYSTEDAEWGRKLQCGLKAARRMRLAQVGKASRPKVAEGWRKDLHDSREKYGAYLGEAEPRERKPVRTIIDKNGDITEIRAYGQ